MGYHILLSSISPKSRDAEDVFENLSYRRIDGLIMVPSFIYQSPKAQKTLAELLRQRIPIVGMMSNLSQIIPTKPPLRGSGDSSR